MEIKKGSGIFEKNEIFNGEFYCMLTEIIRKDKTL